MRGYLLLCLVVALPRPAAADDAPNYWSYTLTSDGKQNATALWWEGGEEDFAGKHARFFQELTVLDKSRMHQRTYFDVTDDGVVQLGARGDFEMDKTVTTHESLTSPPLLYIPARFAAGTKRVVKSMTEVKANGGEPSKLVVEGTVEVMGPDKVEVPAGKFDCTWVRTMTTSTMAIGDLQMTMKTTSDACYAVAVGLVRVTSTTDTESRPKQGKPTTTHATSSMSLAKYRVTKPPWQMQAVTLTP